MLYEHIFFDLDRTLWDFDTNSRETLLELSDKYKLKSKGVVSIDDFITDYYHINERMWLEYGNGLIDKNTLRYDRFYQALVKYSITDRSLAENFGNDYISLSPLKTNLFPHAIEVLDYLNKKYKLHIITNGVEEVQHIKIKNCGIQGYFGEIITSERSGFKKPDTRIFQYSIDSVKTTTTSSLMIGDSLEADIIGARSAGLHQVYFNPAEQKHEENITYEIKNLKELMGFL
ncbi:MAG: YjjG family noncanonical pyrimidine nucleotidase [Bacteroidota bacterium]